MPVNRNALIRYKTIDKCLQNKYRMWTLEDLIDACSDALYEYEGIDKGVSRRTVQADIQVMRSDKLGYNAPITVIDKKFYIYEDPDYSITNIPLTDQDLGKLYEAVDFLKQFQGFSHFKELDGMVQKLEDHVYAQKNHLKPVIDFEKNDNLKGLEYLDQLYRAIIHRNTLKITYQSFKARKPDSFNFYPYLLKEFRNRWFLVGSKKDPANLLFLALDRIEDIEKSDAVFREAKNFDSSEFFKNVIGVSASPNAPVEEIILFITHKHAPYVLTKPFHWSQKLLHKDNYGVTISLHVQHNFELEKDILGLGDGIKVIAPNRLRRNIKERLEGGLDLYNTELSEGGLITAKRKLEHKGSTILNFVYTRKEISKIKALIESHLRENNKQNIIKESGIIESSPEIKKVLFNQNLNRIITSISKKVKLISSTYFEKPPKLDSYEQWQQNRKIHIIKEAKLIEKQFTENQLAKIFIIRIHLDDTNERNGALKAVLGSQKKLLAKKEIDLITDNTNPHICEVAAGGVHLMSPLLLNTVVKSNKQKKRRILHLVFSDKTKC